MDFAIGDTVVAQMTEGRFRRPQLVLSRLYSYGPGFYWVECCTLHGPDNVRAPSVMSQGDAARLQKAQRSSIFGKIAPPMALIEWFYALLIEGLSKQLAIRHKSWRRRCLKLIQDKEKRLINVWPCLALWLIENDKFGLAKYAITACRNGPDHVPDDRFLKALGKIRQLYLEKGEYAQWHEVHASMQNLAELYGSPGQASAQLAGVMVVPCPEPAAETALAAISLLVQAAVSSSEWAKEQRYPHKAIHWEIASELERLLSRLQAGSPHGRQGRSGSKASRSGGAYTGRPIRQHPDEPPSRSA